MLWELRLPLICSISAAIVTIVLKFFGYYVSGSVGLFSDAIESLVNLLASVTAFLSLWYASQPADASHTYGHEKIEYFSSGLEGSLILVAAGSIAWSAAERLFNNDADPGIFVCRLGEASFAKLFDDVFINFRRRGEIEKTIATELLRGFEFGEPLDQIGVGLWIGIVAGVVIQV